MDAREKLNCAPQSTFANLAARAIETADEFTKAMSQLSTEQKKVVETYDKAKKSLDAQIKNADEARQAAIGQINQAFAAKKADIEKMKVELKKEFEEELVRVCLRKEDVPLAEYKVVQMADKAAKSTLGLFGKVSKYVKNAVNEGGK